MSDNIYAPPESDVAVDDRQEPDFYVVSTTKFVLLALLTLNLYLVYWFYRNWRAVKLRTGEDIWPPMRGVFYIFFTHSLFTDVNERLKDRGANFDWQPMALATAVVVLTVLGNVLDRLASRAIGSPTTDVVAIAVVPLLTWFMVTAQRAVNVASGDPGGSGNSNLSFANWLWMLLGGLVWLLALTGLYLILFAPEWLAE